MVEQSSPTSPPGTTELMPSASREGFLARLQRHKVIQWTLAYAAAAYTLLHVEQMIGEAFDWPRIVARIFTLVLIASVPVVATLAWYHGAKGLKGVTVGELAIITLLGLMAGSALWALTGNRREQRASSATAITGGPSSLPPSTIGIQRTAVAVMPFTNETGDERKDYLGEGMATELINVLSKIPGLMVPAQTSSFAYQGRHADIRQIGQDLGVGTVLEGAVQTAGDRIRVTADLIDAHSGLHLWSDTYERQFTDLFKLQDELASAIVQALKVKLDSDDLSTIAQAHPTSNVEAYDLFLQAYALIDRWSDSNFKQGLVLLQQALSIDPGFARAYGMLAIAHLTAFDVYLLPSEHFRQAELFAKRALALDPNEALARETLSEMSADRGRWLDMAKFDQAAADTNDADTVMIYAIHQHFVGHLREAQQQARRASELAPASAHVAFMAASIYSHLGNDSEATRYARLARELGAPAQWLDAVDAASAGAAGHYAEASDLMSRAIESWPDSSRALQIIKLADAALADPSRRNTAIAAGPRLYPENRSVTPVNSVAAIRSCMYAVVAYAGLGAVDAAYRLMSRCLAEQPSDAAMIGEAALELWGPAMRPFRQDPRFQALVRRLGLMDYWRMYGPPDDCELSADKLTCH